MFPLINWKDQAICLQKLQAVVITLSLLKFSWRIPHSKTDFNDINFLALYWIHESFCDNLKIKFSVFTVLTPIFSWLRIFFLNFSVILITMCSGTYLSYMVSHHFITFPCAGYVIQHIYESVQGHASADYNTTIWCLQWKQRTLQLKETHSHMGELVSGLILSGTVPK